jgi:hypothetical protein
VKCDIDRYESDQLQSVTETVRIDWVVDVVFMKGQRSLAEDPVGGD